MADSIDASNRTLEILKKEGEITDENIVELRRLVGQLASSMELFASATYSNVANFRMSMELIAAIRTFDKASADLITTTNKLTNRILILTYVVVGLGLISVIPVVRDLISFFVSK